MIKEVSFDITYNCPYQCLHCSNDLSCRSEKLYFEDFRRCIQYFLEVHDLKIVELGGGEPFCHPDFIRMIELIPKQIRKIIYTSGAIGLTGHNYLTLDEVKFLKALGVTQLNVSIYSHLADIHNLIMNSVQAYESVMLTLENLKKAELPICIHTVVTKLNIDCLTDTIVFLNKKFSITTFRLLRFVPQGLGRNNSSQLQLNEDQVSSLKMFFKQLKSRFPSLNISLAGHPTIDKCRPYNEITHQCAAGIEFVHVIPNSKIIPCPSFKWLKNDRKYALTLDNIHEIKNWMKIKRKDCWQKEIQLSQIRKVLS